MELCRKSTGLQKHTNQ